MIVIIACGIIILDQVTKFLALKFLPLNTPVPLIKNFLNLTLVRNHGAAFGLFSDSPSPWKTVLLIFISAALLLAVVSFVWRVRRLQWEAGVGLALIMGGAFSNLLDRIRAGRVIDFLDVYLRSYHWYTFNLADSAIVVGAGFLVLQVAFTESSHDGRAA